MRSRALGTVSSADQSFCTVTPYGAPPSRARCKAKVGKVGLFVPGPKSEDTTFQLVPLRLLQPESSRSRLPSTAHASLRETSGELLPYPRGSWYGIPGLRASSGVGSGFPSPPLTPLHPPSSPLTPVLDTHEAGCPPRSRRYTYAGFPSDIEGFHSPPLFPPLPPSPRSLVPMRLDVHQGAVLTWVFPVTSKALFSARAGVSVVGPANECPGERTRGRGGRSTVPGWGRRDGE